MCSCMTNRRCLTPSCGSVISQYESYHIILYILRIQSLKRMFTNTVSSCRIMYNQPTCSSCFLRSVFNPSLFTHFNDSKKCLDGFYRLKEPQVKFPYPISQMVPKSLTGVCLNFISSFFYAFFVLI